MTDGIYRADRDGKNVTRIIAPDDLQPPDFSRFVGFPMGIQVDPVNDHVYFVSTSDDTIWRSDFEASEFVAVHETSGDDPHQIAVDMVNGHIYWVEDNGREAPARVGRCDLGGGNEVILIEDAGARAGGIALDEKNGHIFWTESYYSPDPVSINIWRCNLDGSNPQPIISEFDEDAFDLGSIAVDPQARKIYFIQDQSEIHRANDDGAEVELLFEEETLWDRSHIAIDTTTDELFWTSPNGRMIGKASLDGSSKEPFLSNLDSGTFGIAVVSSNDSLLTPPVLTNLRLVQLPEEPDRIQFDFQTEAGVHYTVRYSEALTESPWTQLYELDGDGNSHHVDEPSDQGIRYFSVSATP